MTYSGFPKYTLHIPPWCLYILLLENPSFCAPEPHSFSTVLFEPHVLPCYPRARPFKVKIQALQEKYKATLATVNLLVATLKK